MTTPPSLAADAPIPPLAGEARLPWRVLLLLTAAVVFAHWLALGLMPSGLGPTTPPVASEFITRTIAFTPPPPAAMPAPAPPAAATPAAAPKAARPAPPKRPHAITPPRTEPAPSPPVMTADASLDPTPVAPAAEVAAEAGAAEAAAGPNGGGGAAVTGGTAGGELAGLGAGPAQPMVMPGSITLSLEASGMRGSQPISGVFGDLVWLQNGNAYAARLVMKLLFFNLLNWTSSGTVDAYGIAPTRYSETRRSEVASHLVRDQGKVVFSSNAPSVPLLPGAQDRLSVVMQLGGLIAGNPAGYPPGSRIDVQTVGPRDADVWEFKVEGDETVDVPAGQFNARKLTRSPRRDYDYKLELWLAPEIGYLPVRIMKTETNGDIIDMRLRGKSTPQE